MKTHSRPLVALLLLLGLLSCYPATRAAPPAVALPSPDLWQQYLPELAKGHSDKTRLAAFATSILRRLDPPVKDFADKMNTEQRRLLTRLENWARNNKIDLKFHFSNDVYGQAREALEKADGKAIEFSGNGDFQRYMLMFMSSDYDWQRHLIAALIPHAKDPELKGYLEDSLRVHEEQFKMIDGLLKNYKWSK